jgi:AcrR family transcriptional regulator
MSAPTTSTEEPFRILRRPPQQDRSRRRVLTVLDAAEHLLADQGAGALTTTEVARRAHISVGSLYQWFGDKETIAEALVLRSLAVFEERAAALAEEAERRPTGDPVGVALEAFIEELRARRGFLALWHGGLRGRRLREISRPGLEAITASVARMLRAEAPGADRREIDEVAGMLVVAADALLRQAFGRARDGDPLLLRETTTMLRGYVRERLGVGA